MNTEYPIVDSVHFYGEGARSGAPLPNNPSAYGVTTFRDLRANEEQPIRLVVIT